MAQLSAKALAFQPPQKRPLWTSVLIHAVLGFWSLVCLFPLYWVVVTSLKGETDIIAGPYYLPYFDFTPKLQAWIAILSYSNDHLVMRFYNSAFVGIVSTFMTVLTGGLAVYGLTRFRYKVPWSRLLLVLIAVSLVGVATFLPISLLQFLFAVIALALIFLAAQRKQFGPTLENEGIVTAILATRILPPIVVVLPIYMMALYAGLLDSRVTLIVTYTAANLPVAIWLLMPVFGNTATPQEEAAQLDGASHFLIFFNIFLPMVAASMAAVGMIVFILCWNEYLFAVYLASDSVSTMPPWVIGQMSIKEAQVGGDSQEWPQLSAAIIFMVTPVLACTGLAQRYLSQLSRRR